jgi:hypothetical protein
MAGKKKVEEKKATKKAAPKATPKKEKAAAKPKAKKTNIPDGARRGRPKGVKYQLPEEKSELLVTQFEQLESVYNEFSDLLDSFMDKGNKRAAALARKSLMSMNRMCKEMRATVQDAKMSLKQVPA